MLMHRLAEIQSHLLRLSILLATSLSTLSEPTAPAIVVDPSSSSSSTFTPAKELSKQILDDLQMLITSVQKSCTNLTLALRPSSSNSQSDPVPATSTSSVLSPIAGLDDASLEAAKAQIVSTLNDSVPKLVFLARKATSEATLYRYVAKTADEMAKEMAERQFVRSKGGHVIKEAHARETEKLERMKGRGLGKAWAKSISSAVFELLEALGELSQTYMDERTRQVLLKASTARDKADGVAAQLGQQHVISMPKNAQEARQQALQATGVVWEVCDAALKGNRKLLGDNRAAVQLAWKRRTEVLRDALREYNEALEEQVQEPKGGDEEPDEDDLLAGLESMQLSDDQRLRAKRYSPLLRGCCQLHVKAGEIFLAQNMNGRGVSELIDLDDLDQAGEDISEAVDDLIAVLLYGDAFEVEDEEEAEQDGEDESEIQDAVKRLVDATKALHTIASVQDSARQAFEVQWGGIREALRQVEPDIEC